MTDWRPLPSYAVDAAADVEVAALDRVRSLAALRVLVALRCIAGLSTEPQDPSYPTATCSLADIASFSGLSRSSVQKGVRELRDARVLTVTEWDPSMPWALRAFVMLPIKDIETGGEEHGRN